MAVALAGSMRRLLVANLVLTLTSAGDSLLPFLAPAALQEPRVPNYEDDLRPILEQHCVDCHRGSRAKNGFALNAYAGLMQGGSSGAAIQPGDAAGSLLWQLVSHEREPHMPYESEKLDDATLATIRDWIDGGARETATSEPGTSAKPAIASIVLPAISAGAVVLPEGLRQEPHAWSERGDAVIALAASPTSPLLAVGLQEQIAFFHLDTREPLGVLAFPEGRVHALVFSRDGTLLVAGGGRGAASGRAVVFDVQSGARLAELGTEPDLVLACDLSSDRSLLALGGPDRVARVFDLRTSAEVYATREHTDWITTLGFSPDGVLLATADRAGAVLVREAWTGRIFHELPAHRSRVTSLAWRADSALLATATEEGRVRVYEMESGGEARSWAAPGSVLSIAFLPDGRLVTAGRNDRARVWDGAGQQLAELPVANVPATAVVASSDGSRVVVGDFAGRLTIFKDGVPEAELAAAPPLLLERAIASQRGVIDALRGEGEALAAERAACASERAAIEQALGALTERERGIAERERAFTERMAGLEAEFRALEERCNEARRAILASGGRVE